MGMGVQEVSGVAASLQCIEVVSDSALMDKSQSPHNTILENLAVVESQDLEARVSEGLRPSSAKQ